MAAIFEPIFSRETVVLTEKDDAAVDKCVDDSFAVQQEYNDATTEARRKEIATERHTTERTLEQGAFCVSDRSSWKTKVKRGLVFSLHFVVSLWLLNNLSHDHICNPALFPEALPYHGVQVAKDRRFEIYLQAFRVTDRSRFLEEAESVYNDLPKKKAKKGATKPPWDSIKDMFEGFLASGSFVYVGRSVKGGYWRYWNTKKSVLAKTADGYKTQTVVGIMQALVGKRVVEHRGVVLWRAGKDEVVTAFDQCRLELFFGAMVFKPSRQARRPPGTDQVLNWAAYGLWEKSKKLAGDNYTVIGRTAVMFW
jgi:hypothetical protein